MNDTDSQSRSYSPTLSGSSAELTRRAANYKNMLLLTQLRWMAIAGQIVTIAIVHFGLGITLPLLPMLQLLGVLALFNLVSLSWLRQRASVRTHALLYALMLDVVALTIQLYLSGGATNPFAGLYLLQITLAAVLLDVRAAWSVVLLAAGCLLLLTQVYQPLDFTARALDERIDLQVAGMLVCYGLDAALLVIFITRISRNLRERDAHLAELTQRAAEEDHIVRMGLLASGAAHELGTPLASLAVILGDWRRMPTVADQPELLADIDDMQAAVQRCKAIVTGILLSAGEARGEASSITTVNDFLDDTVQEWQAARPAATLIYRNEFGTDESIVSDSTLRQVIANLLDNACDASPEWVALHVSRTAESLILQINDRGPGFAPEILQEFGKPYRSTKGRRGGGLGLFLVVNVVRKLGGTVVAENRREGERPDAERIVGAAVTVTLPLAMLHLDDEEDPDD